MSSYAGDARFALSSSDRLQVLRDVLLSSDESSTGAAATRPHDQLFQMLSLALELLPPLPKPESERRFSGGASVGTAASGASSRALEVRSTYSVIIALHSAIRTAQRALKCPLPYAHIEAPPWEALVRELWQGGYESQA